MSHTRLIRFLAVEDGGVYVGSPLCPGDIDVASYLSDRTRSPLTARVLASDDILDASLSPTDTIRTVAKLLPILPPARIPSIRALGANYVQPGQDAAQAKAGRPPLPILFFKPPQNCVVGEGDAIVVPKEMSEETDYEVELVVVIGRDCKDVKKEEAFEYVRGYTLGNDVSARKRMFAVPQWGLGKGADTFFPLSHTLVLTSSLSDPESVSLRTHVNGELLQDGNTRDHLWRVAETIEKLSEGTTLHKGTLISMGTPPGEGFKRKPQRFLKHGDTVTISGSHGLGSLTNPVVEAAKLQVPGVAKAKL